MRSSKLITNYNVDIEKILNDWFSSYTVSDDGVFIKKIIEPKRKIMIFIAEDYYLRITSTITFTVIVEQTIDQIFVEVVSSGGESGLLGYSSGAEDSAVNRVVKFLKAYGFSVIDPEGTLLKKGEDFLHKERNDDNVQQKRDFKEDLSVSGDGDACGIGGRLFGRQC